MKNLAVILDPAHGSNIAGKCSPDALKGNKSSKYYFREYQWSREFCKYYLEPTLKSHGIQVFYTVDPNNEYEPGLRNRVQMTNKIIKDHPGIHFIFLSPHVNAAGDAKEYKVATGWSIYTSKSENNSDILADCIIR